MGISTNLVVLLVFGGFAVTKFATWKMQKAVFERGLQVPPGNVFLWFLGGRMRVIKVYRTARLGPWDSVYFAALGSMLAGLLLPFVVALIQNRR